jgi:hypothetical protein
MSLSSASTRACPRKKSRRCDSGLCVNSLDIFYRDFMKRFLSIDGQQQRRLICNIMPVTVTHRVLFVIASVAKQSIIATKMDCFVATLLTLAPLTMTLWRGRERAAAYIWGIARSSSLCIYNWGIARSPLPRVYISVTVLVE